MPIQIEGGVMLKKLMKWFCLTLVTLFCTMLMACVPSSLEKAKEKMAKEGYTTVNILPALPGADGCIGGIYASEGLFDEDKITAYLFETAENAKVFLANWDKLVGKGTAIQNGKWVYAGSEDAIEDFVEGLF